MEIKYKLNSEVFINFAGRICRGIIRGYHIEVEDSSEPNDFNDYYIIETNHKSNPEEKVKRCLSPSCIFDSEIDAVNSLLESYGVNKSLRFSGE